MAKNDLCTGVKSLGARRKQHFFKNKMQFVNFYSFFTQIIIKPSYNQVRHIIGVSCGKIASCKKPSRSVFMTLNTRNFVIEGPGIKVEVDETVLCRRVSIRTPTSADDNIKDILWILGVIDSVN
ncbi:hypothetical protein NGRA_2863 [Nosema granulosis]|uniref:Uncharacterized protein n=1 Tax=Nosema granulosis TaxID=83296 RepID=A0A9P6KXR0_9MICR|nr:hypothetical protein NGRA_2863 [Nosema granulosis]